MTRANIGAQSAAFNRMITAITPKPSGSSIKANPTPRNRWIRVVRNIWIRNPMPDT